MYISMSILSLHNPTTYGENYTHTYQPTVYDSYTMVGVIVCLPYHPSGMACMVPAYLPDLISRFSPSISAQQVGLES